MRCSRAQNLYDDYVSGGLDPETARLVEEHLANCPECRELFETNDDIAELISSGVEVAHPGNPYVADLSSRVLASVLGGEGKSASPPSPLPSRRAEWNRPLWWAGAAAAAALVVFGLNAPTAPDDSDADIADPGEARSELPTAPGRPFAAAGVRETDWAAPTAVAQASPSSFAVPVAVAPALSNPVRSVEAQPSFDGPTISKSVVKNRADQERAAQERAERQQRAVASLPPMGEPDSRDFVLRFFVGVDVQESDPRRAAAPARPGQFDLPAQWLTQILQLDAMNTPDSRRQMVKLLQEIADSADKVAGARDARGEQPTPSNVIRQCALYRQAEAHLADGNADDALKAFEQVFILDRSTPLASRAVLRIADLHYDTSGDYRQAWRHYGMLGKASAQSAITADESARAKRRAALLTLTEGTSWESIRAARSVREAEWPEALETLRQLSRGPIFKQLLADLAEPLARRLDATLPMDEGHARELNDMLNVGITSMGDDPHAQAWLSLAQGDLLHLQFKRPEAQRSYQFVIMRDRESAAAQIASARLQELLRSGAAPMR